jgi:hypothetical protein
MLAFHMYSSLASDLLFANLQVQDMFVLNRILDSRMTLERGTRIFRNQQYRSA